jgi:hypothetical protein
MLERRSDYRDVVLSGTSCCGKNNWNCIPRRLGVAGQVCRESTVRRQSCSVASYGPRRGSRLGAKMKPRGLGERLAPRNLAYLVVTGRLLRSKCQDFEQVAHAVCGAEAVGGCVEGGGTGGVGSREAG